jgi:hypothetical protein
MKGLERILFPKQLLKTAKNKIEHGVESLEREIGKYTEKGINIMREYLETAKYVVPSVLISSSIYGRMGYYGSMLLVCSVSKGGIGGGWYSKIPTIVGTTVSILSLGIGLYALHLDQVLQHQLQVTEDNDNITLAQIQQEILKINVTLAQMQNNVNSMNNNYNITLTQIQQEIEEINATLTQMQSNYQTSQQEIQTLSDQVQDLLQQLATLKNYYTLEGILFGNNNDISLIQIKSATVENGTVYAQGTVYSSGSNVILEIPIGYAEKSNNNDTVTIQDLVNVAQQNGWIPYVVLDKGDLQYLSLSNNQNGTYVISIQPNKPIKIGIMATPADPSTIYNILNNLGNYDIVIQDNYTVWGLPNALWGYKNGSVVVDFSNNYQYNLAENMINIADQIINSPGNPNPTSEGIIYTFSIFDGTISTYQNYTEYIVGGKYIPIIVLKPKEGESIIDTDSS